MHIYTITHLKSGKKYVLATQDIRRRWKAYLNDKRRMRPFIKAIREYGQDAFRVERIDECSDSEITDRVRYWVQKLNTLVPNGYNVDRRAKLTQERKNAQREGRIAARAKAQKGSAT